MKNVPLCAAALLSFLLAACSGGSDQPSSAAAPKAGSATSEPAAKEAEAPAARSRHTVATAEEIAAIQASGHTGLWVEPAEICSDAKRQVVTLKWNAPESTADKLVVYLVSKTGEERNFGRGGPVGRQSTGPWARPGQVFILRAQEGGAELGRTTVGEKQC